MEFEMVEKMTVAELKNYLRLCDLKLTGRKSDLVARVFTVHSQQPSKYTDKLTEEWESRVAVECKSLDEYQASIPIFNVDGLDHVIILYVM